MITNELLYLPVSLGEAIDKLTILDIKMDKMIDNRKHDVKREYDLLYTKLKCFIIKYETLYQTMKKINLLIWNMMDLLRDGNIDEDLYLTTCKECIEYNDIRFRVKNKINYVSNSVLKEQKNYKINRLVILINNNNIDNLENLLSIITYFSFIYDEITIVSDYNVDYLKQYFKCDNTIIFNSTNEGLLLDYKCIVIVKENNYTKNDFYKLFNINKYNLELII